MSDYDSDETVLFGGFVLLQNLLIHDSQKQYDKKTPYRPPIAYEGLKHGQ